MENNAEKNYIGTYNVVRFYRNNPGRRDIIQRGLTLEEAKRVVNRYPDSNKTLVGFVKQYSANKWFKTDQEIEARLEYLRHEVRAERISYGELAELQGLSRFIHKDDVELLEAAGVPEFAS
jgi:hypothetical protein